MSVNGIPAGYALPLNTGIPAGFVPAAVQPYLQGAQMPGTANAALGPQMLGQAPSNSGIMGAIRSALAAIGFGGGGAMPQAMPQYLQQPLAPMAMSPAPVVVAKPKPKPKPKPKAKPKAHHAKPKPHHAKPKPHHAKPKPHHVKPVVVKAASISGAPTQTLPLVATGSGGYVGSLPFGGIAGGIGAGADQQLGGNDGPQVNATNQSGLAGSTNPLNQHVTNDNTFKSDGYSSVESPYGAYGAYGSSGSMYGGTGPVLGWNNPLGYAPAGGYGASMGATVNLGMQPKTGISGFFSRLLGG